MRILPECFLFQLFSRIAWPCPMWSIY